jgi:hypothetical protein
MCNQLMDAKLLPESAKELQTQLLCSAADALLSSHALTSNVDVGMRLVALLLVPHCSSRTDLRITATLANALEHYAPQQDAAADTVLELVTPLITEKKSIRILDACISGIVVARYRHYSAADAKKAMKWLVTGKGLEEKLLDASSSTCLGLIEQASHKMSFGLLKLLGGATDYETDSSTMAAQAMVRVLAPGQQNVDAVRLLQHVTTMAVATLEQQTDRNEIMAHGIADCLATTTASKTTASLANKGHCLAPPSMHGDLMMIARTILDQDEECYNKLAAANFESSFTTRDMHVLMERQLQLDIIIGSNKDADLNLVLAKGLMRALLTENAQRKAPHALATLTTTSMCSTRIESYSPIDQEVLVQRMLDL